MTGKKIFSIFHEAGPDVKFVETSAPLSTLIKIEISSRTGNAARRYSFAVRRRPEVENWVARGEGLLAGRMSRSRLIGSSSRRV